MKKITSLFAILWLCATTLSAQWTQINNISIPAEFGYFEISGSTLYASVNNAVYKSTNNGASWTKLGLPDLNYAQFIVHASGNIVGAISGYSLFHYSTNGGATFQQSSLNAGYLSDFLVNGNKVFMVAETGLYVSTDYGATFTNTNLISPNGFMFGYFSQTPVGKLLIVNIFSVNGDPSSFVYRSTDDVNWTDISGTGGSNPLPAGQNGRTFLAYYYIAYFNGAILAGGLADDGLGAFYKSTDLGANWFPVDNSIFAHQGRIGGAGSSRIYAYGDSGQKTSTDLVNWTSLPPPYLQAGSGTTFLSVGTLNSYNGIYLSTNSGATWAPTAGQPSGNDIVRDYLDAGNYKFVATAHYGIHRGTGNNPANMSWTRVLGYGNNSSNAGRDLLKKGNVLLAAMDYDDVYPGEPGIYRSTNNGNSWVRTHTGAGLCLFDEGNAIYAGVRNDGIYKSTNSGQTWTAMNNGLPSNQYQRSPTAILRAGNKLVASFLSAGIYISSNNGGSWSQASTQNLVYCLAKSGSTLFAGTEAGLLKSTDQGATWSLVQNDVTGIHVTALYVKDDVLFIGTGNQGMYLSTDGGETLEPHNDGAGDNTFVSFIGRDGDQLLAGWNMAPGFQYYFDLWSDLGRSLWYENEYNLRPSPATERSGTSPAKPGLAIFPNPVQDVLRFSSNVKPAQIAGIQLINAKGETVRDLSGESLLRPSVDVQDLPNGPYFFRMTMLDGTQLVRRFMVQRTR